MSSTVRPYDVIRRTDRTRRTGHADPMERRGTQSPFRALPQSPFRALPPYD
ncbi:hypothetical protein OG885_18840 [Streptomyces sp. NBC_00028]|uniref:hypothetical protein n=1 Tax=Streptomyces sp. NBC_00028 TaxID=2975624 RepID=UPI0032499F22